MVIHFLSRRSFRAHCFTYPIRAFAGQIRQLGLKCRIYHDPDHPRLTDCDVLCVVSDHFGLRYLRQSTARVLERLEQYRGQVGTLIWCDNTDGAGTMFLEAFPFVNLYAKKQLLRDRQIYRQRFYGNEYHLHYYYIHHGDKLEAMGSKPALSESALELPEIDKLALSWNVGLGDYNTFWNRGRRFRAYWPWTSYRKRIRDAASLDRPIDVCYRASTSYSLPVVSFIRQEVRRQLAALATCKHYHLIYEGKVSLGRYLDEISHARITPSPFGWGQICWRDFECLLCGSLLMKPNMDHLETWPDYYETDVTYVSHDWDFTDFQAKVVELLESPGKCHDIAQVGQERYLASISSEGGEAFARHFAALVSRAVGAR